MLSNLIRGNKSAQFNLKISSLHFFKRQTKTNHLNSGLINFLGAFVKKNQHMKSQFAVFSMNKTILAHLRKSTTISLYINKLKLT